MSMINQKQVLSLQQKLSPQQIQMIKLLELPTMQLEQRIKQEIEENIVLEEDDHTPEDEQPQQISVEEYLREDETPSYKSRINNYSKDDKPRQAPLAGGRSLQEYLVEQLGYRNLSEQDMRLAVYLVGSIEEDGYLRRSLEAIADDIAFTQGVDVSVEHLERLLSIIHELEPTGVGARNLQECLLLQLDQENLNTRSRRLARKIVECYFDEFVKKHYEKLMARLQVSEDEFREAIEEITRLSPKPGNLYSEGGADTTPYVTPDFILDYHEGHFDLTLNSGNLPEARINHRYIEMMRGMVDSDGRVKEKDREAIQFVKSKIDSAKWFISAIKQRHDTLMRTMQTILDYQQEYFKDGDKSKLRPMILKDIADRTGLDIALEGMLIGALSLFAFVAGNSLFKNSCVELGRTMAFATQSLCEIAHSFNMRSRRSVFSIGIFSNRKLTICAALCAALQLIVMTVPPLRVLFDVSVLNIYEWLTVAALALAPIAFSELGKAVGGKREE